MLNWNISLDYSNSQSLSTSMVLKWRSFVELIKSRTLRVHFFGKNPNPDSESKNGFFVSLAKSKKGLWIQWIRTRWRFSGLIRIRILRIHDFCVSLGKDSKNVHVVSGPNTRRSCIQYRWKNPVLDLSFLSQGLICDYPFSDFLFLSQKRIRVVSRNNPILDFTKEMHPYTISLCC